MTLEQLGYTCTVDDGDLMCEIKKGSATYYVTFYDDKSFETYGFAKGHDINHPIDMELNEAIQNKLKELKWI